MKNKNKTKSKKSTALSWAGQIALMAVLLLGISIWQSRHLLPSDAQAPEFHLASLDGQQISLQDYKEKKVVLYFFAPWCTVCKYSSSNVEGLYESADDNDPAVFAVALNYESKASVKKFVDDHDLRMPVLLGKDSIKQDYKISSFPTIYILNKDHTVASRTVGYTSKLGLKLRSLL